MTRSHAFVAMIGDTNLFFNNSEEPHEAEIEIMIAEPTARGRGFGRTALFMMMHFAVEKLGVSASACLKRLPLTDTSKVKKFVARIGDANAASIQLFTKLGYQQVSHSAVFKETTFAVQAEALRDDLARANEELITGVYDPNV